MDQAQAQSYQIVQNNKLQLVALVVAVILFIAVGLLGVLSGFNRGKSLATYHNVDITYQALTMYKKDQSVYPTPVQFSDQQILRFLYLSGTPTPADVNGTCAKSSSFVYTQDNPNNFHLQFCLLQGINGYKSGLNTISSPQ